MTAIAADRLKSFVERAERLQEEQRAAGKDVSDVLTEAAGEGFDKRAIRRLLAERRQKDREAQADLLDTYRRALGMASYRDVAERFGISKTKLQRLVPKHQNGTVEMVAADITPHDPETGEVNQSCGGVESRHAHPSAASLVEGGQRPAPGQEPREHVEAGVAPGPQEPDWDAIVASQPPQLRRVSP